MDKEKTGPTAQCSTTPQSGVAAFSDATREFQELIQHARDGKESAFNELMRTCRDYLLLVANDELGGNLRAKLGPSDIVQSVCLLAHRNIDQFRGNTQRELLAWLRIILRNEVLAAHRRFTAGKRDVEREERTNRAASELCDGQLRTPSTEAMLREEAAALRTALGRLAPDHRRILLLRNWDRLPFEEIAQRMSRSSDAAKKLWARAVAQLRKELTDEETERAS